ncbi:hypothetical protein F6P81_02905 [Streptococcus suis]|nr:hypothetical protein [Streptococcus suis]MBS8081556.1 hypothetical protein [Streptococcus suis]MBS8083769.1 hypothetical protein [Streptococcus suis]MBS8111232.1 hypothetical protein [Streptococcus suis]
MPNLSNDFVEEWEWERTRPFIEEFVFPPPAQLIRSDLECKTRTNLPINHCAEMLTRTLSSGPGLFAQPPLYF